MRYLILLLLPTLAFAQQPPAAGNFVYIDQIGNNNTIVVTQEDSEQKRAAIFSVGDANDISIVQQGTGNHTALIGPTNSNTTSYNSNNLLNITQQGAGNHTASILFGNPSSNSNNTASITQKGGVGADKQFTLQLQGSGIGATVIQDNLTTPDSSTMSIQCLTPPCTGYSYTKH
jgi:hypothetical protein